MSTQQRARTANLARLLKEDWSEMTRTANESPRHTGNLDRWRAKALESNPGLSAEQADRIAVRMRSEHYRALAARSAEVRRGNAAVVPA